MSYDAIKGKKARAIDSIIAISPKAVPRICGLTIIGTTGTRQFEYKAYPIPKLYLTYPRVLNP